MFLDTNKHMPATFISTLKIVTHLINVQCSDGRGIVWVAKKTGEELSGREIGRIP